jgi:hypothetical protein
MNTEDNKKTSKSCPIISRWKKPVNYREVVEYFYGTEKGKEGLKETYQRFVDVFDDAKTNKEKLRRITSMIEKYENETSLYGIYSNKFDGDHDKVTSLVAKKLTEGRGQTLPAAVTDKLLHIILHILRQKNAKINVDIIKNVLVYLIYMYDKDTDLYKKLHCSLGGESQVVTFDLSFIKRFIKNQDDLNPTQKAMCVSTADNGFYFPIDVENLKSERLKRARSGSQKLIPSNLLENLGMSGMINQFYADKNIIYPDNHIASSIIRNHEKEKDPDLRSHPDNYRHMAYTTPVKKLDIFDGIDSYAVASKVTAVSPEFRNVTKAVRNEVRRFQRKSECNRTGGGNYILLHFRI